MYDPCMPCCVWYLIKNNVLLVRDLYHAKKVVVAYARLQIYLFCFFSPLHGAT